jgi:quercetin dioxygenase-like cupin family protein
MVAGHQGSKRQGGLNKMPILRQMLGRSPNGPKARVRNFIANARLGTKATTIHESVISPGVAVPWHTHVTEEVIVVLSGEGECRTENGTQPYSAGDVLIFPAGVKHSLRNPGTVLLRQLCIFPADPRSQQLEAESAGQVVEVFNM